MFYHNGANQWCYLHWIYNLFFGKLVDVARIRPHQSKVVTIQGFLIFATPTNVKAS